MYGKPNRKRSMAAWRSRDEELMGVRCYEKGVDAARLGSLR